MSVTYAAAGDLLERLRGLAEEFDGDVLEALLAEDVSLQPGPFGPPVAGRVAIRAYLWHAAEQRRQVEATIERHWVSGDTVLASWQLSYVEEDGGRHVRVHGFTTLELRDGFIVRIRVWSERRVADTGRP